MEMELKEAAIITGRTSRTDKLPLDRRGVNPYIGVRFWEERVFGTPAAKRSGG